MRIHAVHELIEHRLNLSTKPFRARGAKVERCLRCRIAKKYCVCDYQPQAHKGLACLLIYSENEVLKPSNTGRLIADVCMDSHTYQWQRTEPQQGMLDLLNDPCYQPLLVFPQDYLLESQQSLALSPGSYNLEQGKTPLFIFLDASWREARRIYRKSEYLQQLPVVSIAPQKISNYVMRKAEKDHQLATSEVAGLVFEEFGFTDTANALELWFEVFKESYMLSKTREKRDFSRPVLQQFLG